jgi:hypothetical protein
LRPAPLRQSRSEDRTGVRGKRILAAATGLLLSLISAAPASATHVSPEFFGVSGFGAPNTQTEWDAVANAGVGTWRANLEWNKVEQNEPVVEGAHDYNWGPFDMIVERAAMAGTLPDTNGIRVLPRLLNAPTWANQAKGGCTASNPVNCPPLENQDGDAMQGWLDFAKAAVARYGPCANLNTQDEGSPAPAGICPTDSFWELHSEGSGDEVPYKPLKWWQVWEEPNFMFRWCRTPQTRPDGEVDCDPSARQYKRFLQDTRDWLLQGNSGIKVLMGGLPNLCTGPPQCSSNVTNVSQIGYLKAVYKKGIKSYISAVALHPYATGKEGVRGAILRAKDVMKSYGGWNIGGTKIPIWVTEFGWSTGGPPNDDCPNDPLPPPSNWPEGKNNPYPPQCKGVRYDQRGFHTDWEGQKRKLKAVYEMLVKHRSDYHAWRGAIWFSLQDDYSNGDLPGSRSWPHYTGLFFRDEYKANPPWPKLAWCGLIGTTNLYLHRSAPKPSTPAGPKCAPPPAP